MGDRVAVLITDRHEVDRYNLPANEIAVQPRLFAFMGIDKYLGKLAFPLKDIPAEHAVLRCAVLACNRCVSHRCSSTGHCHEPRSTGQAAEKLASFSHCVPQIEYRLDSSRF